jgi:hypothetical protein
MAKPQYYDFIRKLKDSKNSLREFSKENQLLSGHLLSEDLLIRSSKEIQKNILPFLKYLLPNSDTTSITDLSTFKRFGNNNN